LTKLNARNILTLTATTTGLSLGFGLIGSYMLQELGYKPQDYIFNTSVAWLAFHAPVISTAISSLKYALGEKQLPSVTANSHSISRRIPFTANGHTSHIFASLLPGIMPKVVEKNSKKPIVFFVTFNRQDYALTIMEIEKFVYIAWRRQNQGKNGLSRQYWTRECRPRLKTLEYNCRMAILSQAGLIIDRSDRRSGRLVLSPELAMKELI
jgi:hypothetical protein